MLILVIFLFGRHVWVLESDEVLLLVVCVLLSDIVRVNDNCCKVILNVSTSSWSIFIEVVISLSSPFFFLLMDSIVLAYDLNKFVVEVDSMIFLASVKLVCFVYFILFILFL